MKMPFLFRKQKVNQWVIGGVLAGLFCFGALFHILYLHYYLESNLQNLKEEPPLRIFADAKIISQGQPFSLRTFQHILNRLQYRKIRRAGALYPGSYSVQEGGYIIYRRPFETETGKERGQIIQIRFEGERVLEISSYPKNTPLPFFSFEPELISETRRERGENRESVELREIPAHFLNTLLSAEDQRFLKHEGIDLRGILRALFRDLIHLSFVEGGSTITQQLVRSKFLSPSKSLWRKFNEIVLAILLEKKFSKEEILEMYLNEVYLGQRGSLEIHGIKAAAKVYFGKELRDLTIAETATIVAMIPGPNYYSPYTRKERLLARRNALLKKMYDQNLLTDKTWTEAKKEPLELAPVSSYTRIAPFFADYIREELEEQDLSAGADIYTTLDVDLQLLAQDSLQSGLASLERSYPHLQKERLEGLFVASDPKSGAILAMEGGRDYSVSQFNRVTQAKRQPGSLFKPLVFLAALHYGNEGIPNRFHAATLLEDSPFSIPSGKELWAPQNYDETFRGKVTFAEALENSINVPTVKLALEVGLENVARVGNALGIQTPLRPLPSLALGSIEVSPLEMAQTYASFANFGTRVPLFAIRFVKGGEKTRVPPKKNSALPFAPRESALLVRMMQNVIERGTGNSARRLGYTQPAAGKTGTTNNFYDAWFAGFTPRLLALSWVGFDKQKSLNLTGAEAALPIWTAFMKEAQKIVPDTSFPFPEDLVPVLIDRETGELANSGCFKIARDWFYEETVPTHTCELHAGEQKRETAFDQHKSKGLLLDLLDHLTTP